MNTYWRIITLERDTHIGELNHLNAVYVTKVTHIFESF